MVQLLKIPCGKGSNSQHFGGISRVESTLLGDRVEQDFFEM